ncbi:hypothetical protein L21SP3_02107 [Sedimentisphaera cyanobacteriorum]|uniref:Uncharacterized protein n=1 Tax=Sedimentisphaera cyanobacteriorum TaxID=1940790 RepID=A0A1Q2HS41_9BACT|nr:hypothetical protein [Sedimentisphaera cyanobacteriorum]AQQ10279.1 hypothetical protein L21SP3_02107 [Sedimentisphaera cyanobacteriorum]
MKTKYFTAMAVAALLAASALTLPVLAGSETMPASSVSQEASLSCGECSCSENGCNKNKQKCEKVEQSCGEESKGKCGSKCEKD